jgi:pyruvate,water dikinase
MALTQVLGTLLIFVLCPLLGGLPVVDWTTRWLTGKQLRKLGTGNISVSAAFYHGGRLAGITAAIAEAAKGILAVLLARYFFPSDALWELIALLALVIGRYWFGGGAGTTNVVWGYVVHDLTSAGLVFLIGGVGFTLLRDRQLGRLSILVLFPLITALRHANDTGLIWAAIALAALLAWIYTQIPDDLELDPESAQASSSQAFRLIRGNSQKDPFMYRAFRTLDQALVAHEVGQKAATLAELRRLGYPVPEGWVLAPGDDPEPLIDLLQPSPQQPFVVRSSAVGEDSEAGAAAGLYESSVDVISVGGLQAAINRCFASYNQPTAVQYRRDRGLVESHMVVLIQPQVNGIFSGVAFSRDPITRQGDTVAVEGLAGAAKRVVSGQNTPESYQVWIRTADLPVNQENWQLPDEIQLAVEGSQGSLPSRLVQQVAYLARCLETHYRGIPQDIEWSYDGQQLWLLQSRAITTLLPIWTRKIAAEVIPGKILPLTWSINHPLTCGVWGDIFTIVLGPRSQGLDFNQTATLHHSAAYFNASLLGEIFQRMGLPRESLEFLTRGAKFSKPPLGSTLQNLPGLLRLVQRELRLEQDFQREYRERFAPYLKELLAQPAPSLDASSLLQRIEIILQQLHSVTYYSILAPLSASLRKAIFRVADENVDNSAAPEVAVTRSLQQLAQSARSLLTDDLANLTHSSTNKATEQIFAELAKTIAGQEILRQFEQIFEQYDYLSEVGTDIAVPTWRETPTDVRELFAQFCLQPLPSKTSFSKPRSPHFVQRRFDLKGKVTEVYSRFLAELRWSFLALEQCWLETGLLQQVGDIFYLEFEELQKLGQLLPTENPYADRIAQRRLQAERDRLLEKVPYLVYGNEPPPPVKNFSDSQVIRQIQGIGASPGQMEGTIKILQNLTATVEINADTILVVPYTDSGWAPLLARAGGLIAEVGGRLSHGAIVAREYQIPAVMDISNALQLFQNGQRVRLDGQQGTVEILEEP